MTDNEAIRKKRCSSCSCMEKTDEEYAYCRVLGFDYQVNDYMRSRPQGKPDWCPVAELEQYRALGTVEELREAIEKQRAKRPVWNPFDWEDKDDPDPCCYWHCPTCGEVLTDYIPGNNKDFYFHCFNCGQKFDWSEEE